MSASTSRRTGTTLLTSGLLSASVTVSNAGPGTALLSNGTQLAASGATTVTNSSGLTVTVPAGTYADITVDPGSDLVAWGGVSESINGRRPDASGNIPVLTHANVALASGAPVLGRLGHYRWGGSGNNGYQDGTNIYTTTQTCCIVEQDCCDLTALFGNFAAFEATDAPNSIIVSAALWTGANPMPQVQPPLGVAHPFYFGGQREVTIGPNGLVKTDPLGVELFRKSATTLQSNTAIGDPYVVTVNPMTPNSYITIGTGAGAETIRVFGPSGPSVGAFGGQWYAYVAAATPLTKAHSAGDPVSYPTAVFIRTRVRLASVGQYWPAGMGADGAFFEGVKYGTTLEGTDSTVTGGTAGGTFTISFDDGTHTYHPVAVMGSTGGRKTRSVALVGDSRIVGTASYLAQALDIAGIPYTNVAKGSELASAWADMTKHRRRMAIIDGHTDAVCEYAINDLGTGTVSGSALLAIQKNLVANWRSLGLRGMRVWQQTIEPQSTSTDSFATVANQTTTAANAGGRVPLNAWIRAGAPLDAAATLVPVAVGTSGALLAGATGHPLSGFIEVADIVESARDSGKWRLTAGSTAMTADGLHPNQTAHDEVGRLLDLSVLKT